MSRVLSADSIEGVFSPTNYIKNGTGELYGTVGWLQYSDGAVNAPVTGTGTAAAGLTFSASTSSPLRGGTSFTMVQTNSTSIQGQGMSYAFTIDSADQAKVLNISFDYNASSTFVASNGTTAPLQDGTSSTNAGNSDVEVFIYDVTNSVKIPVSPMVITGNGANNFTFKGNFQAASNSTSYRLILHVATANANATGWTFKYDNIYVGPQIQVQGSPITDFQAYTPTYTGFGTVSTSNLYYRRIGDSVQITGTFVAGTTTATGGLMTLPSGMNIDTTKISSTSLSHSFGTVYRMTSASGVFVSDSAPAVHALVYDSSRAANQLLFARGSVSNLFASENANSIYSASEKISIDILVPVLGWSSTVSMSNDTDTRVVDMTAIGSSTTVNGTPANVVWTTTQKDSHGAFNGTTYTVAVSGDYVVAVNVKLNASSATAGQECVLALNKNGSLVTSFTAPHETGSSFSCYPTGTKIVPCVAGDAITIQVSSNATSPSISATTTNSSISIFRLSGPSAIANTDSVNARYYSSTSSISSSLANITYATKDYDSHNAMSGATYTIVTAGKYRIQASLLVTATFVLNNTVSMQILKNGTGVTQTFDYAPGAATGFPIDITDQLNCVAGDTIVIQAATTGTGPTLPASNLNHVFSIARVGN